MKAEEMPATARVAMLEAEVAELKKAADETNHNHTKTTIALARELFGAQEVAQMICGAGLFGHQLADKIREANVDVSDHVMHIGIKGAR